MLSTKMRKCGGDTLNQVLNTFYNDVFLFLNPIITCSLLSFGHKTPI